MNAITVGTTVQVKATRDVGKVHAVNGKTITVRHPYSGERKYTIEEVVRLY